VKIGKSQRRRIKLSSEVHIVENQQPNGLHYRSTKQIANAKEKKEIEMELKRENTGIPKLLFLPFIISLDYVFSFESFRKTRIS